MTYLDQNSYVKSRLMPDPIDSTKNWREFVDPKERFFFWSMAEVIASGSDDSRPAPRIDTQNNSAVIGIESPWTLLGERV